MKVDLVVYEHAENFLSLQLCPENKIEEDLLRGFFKHGEMKTGHPGKANGDTGFYISWKTSKYP